MNPQKKKDLQYGLEQEDLLHPILEKKLGVLTKTHSNHTFDYYNDEYVVELKSRPNLTIKTYPSLCFGKNKYLKGLEYITKGQKVLFIFNLKDGIYQWELKCDDLKECYFAPIIRRDRGRFEKQDGCYVKTEFISLFPFQS